MLQGSARKFGALHSINQYTAFILCCELSQTRNYIFLCDLHRLQTDSCKLCSYFFISVLGLTSIRPAV